MFCRNCVCQKLWPLRSALVITVSSQSGSLWLLSPFIYMVICLWVPHFRLIFFYPMGRIFIKLVRSVGSLVQLICWKIQLKSVLWWHYDVHLWFLLFFFVNFTHMDLSFLIFYHFENWNVSIYFVPSSRYYNAMDLISLFNSQTVTQVTAILSTQSGNSVDPASSSSSRGLCHRGTNWLAQTSPQLAILGRGEKGMQVHWVYSLSFSWFNPLSDSFNCTLKNCFCQTVMTCNMPYHWRFLRFTTC